MGDRGASCPRRFREVARESVGFEEVGVFTEREIAVETNVFVALYDENGKLPKLPGMGGEYGEGRISIAEAFKAQVPTATAKTP